MPIGLLVLAGIPTTIGVCEALSAQKKQNAAAKEKAKFHLTATVSLDGRGPVECWCVLRDGKLWIDHPGFPMPGHKFTGYYFTYPSEEKPLGLVSTIADDPPMLNWIFVDKDSRAVRHGGRQDTLGGHKVGPWFWSEDEQWLTLEGDALRFVAVQLDDRKWAVAWDGDGFFSQGRGYKGGSSETESETERPSRPRKWISIMLRRRLQLGMESRYVKGANG
ncbi:hypothetical protein MYCTH_2299604 [Thermothelomyces thermophilus ATCC 42464]|uniref:Uncharacterized protein n=1 Tax=Thermothelomyces thermophilus (strain ATCC 42464 / BCRC 31852 / DSM 1799) TaxID=573729 RepID=G2Q6N0_THET4|nr:uncharacterized protein MYCTH_2299604 [Thermothelomyces thermophilus ATCC 42464]AEO55603.1 hypothetical protein MYCTH_2299604 [Thermothelomyces thermophilus ATCC 42464]